MKPTAKSKGMLVASEGIKNQAFKQIVISTLTNE